MENRVKILIADGNEEFCDHVKRRLEQVPGYEIAASAKGILKNAPIAVSAANSAVRTSINVFLCCIRSSPFVNQI